MDIDAGDSPWGGKEAPSTAPEFQKLTNKMCHRNQKTARQPQAQTTFPRVRISLLNPSYWITDVYVEDGPSSSAQSLSQPATSTPKTAASRKTPARKVGAQATRLEAVDGSHDPLGPLGGDAPFPAAAAASEQAPTPPRKELTQNRNVRPSSSASQASFVKGGLDSPDLTSDGGLPVRQKGPPPVQPPAGGPLPRQTQPSMSIEQAAKPSFDITVGDPHKVGDITSSHIVYQVQTRVSP
jgi:sorting nexin-1/2